MDAADDEVDVADGLEGDADGRVDQSAVGVCLAVGGVCGEIVVAGIVLELLGDAELRGLDDVVASVEEEAHIQDALEDEDRACGVLDHAVAVVSDSGGGFGEPVACVYPLGDLMFGAIHLRDAVIEPADGGDIRV